MVLYPINEKQANQVLQMFTLGSSGNLSYGFPLPHTLVQATLGEHCDRLPHLGSKAPSADSPSCQGRLSWNCIIFFPLVLSQSVVNGKGRAGLFQFRQWTDQNCFPLPYSVSLEDLIYFMHFDLSLLRNGCCDSLLRHFPSALFGPQANATGHGPSTQRSQSGCWAQLDGGVFYEVQPCTLGHKYTLCT